MKNLTKSEKIDFFREMVVKHKLTAYKLAQETGLTERAIQYIIDGKSKNPHSINLERLFQYVTEIEEERTRNFSVKESDAGHNKFSFELDQDEDLSIDGIIVKRLVKRLEPVIKQQQESLTTTQRSALNTGKELARMKIQLREMQRKLDELHAVVVPHKNEN